MSHTETYVEGKKVFECPDFIIRHDQVELEDGRLSRREIVCRPDRTLLLLLQGDCVLLKKTDRPALGGQFLEAPCEPIAAGQSPEQAAQALSLASGGQGRPRWAGLLRPSPALLQEKVHVFAERLEGEAEPGWQAVPLAAWEDWTARGLIKDMRLAAALALADLGGFGEQEAEQ